MMSSPSLTTTSYNASSLDNILLATLNCFKAQALLLGLREDEILTKVNELWGSLSSSSSSQQFINHNNHNDEPGVSKNDSIEREVRNLYT